MITLPLKKAPRDTIIKNIEVSKSFNLRNSQILLNPAIQKQKI